VRKHGLGVRGAACQEQRQHLFFLNQLERVFAGQLGIELVVQRDQLDLLPVDAAFGIDRVNVKLGAIGGFLHPRAHGPGESCRLPDEQLRLRAKAEGRHEQGAAP
jgi:hypothetical protein